MEKLFIEINDEKFDKAVHGGLDDLVVLPERGDLEIFVKRKVTVGSKPGAVITFTVRQTNGTFARVQSVTTIELLEAALRILKGWKDGGHL